VISNVAPAILLRGEVDLQTPEIQTNAAKAGQLFTLLNSSSGQGKWMDPDVSTAVETQLDYNWLATSTSVGTGPPVGHCALDLDNPSQATRLMIHQTDRNAANQKSKLMADLTGTIFRIGQSATQWVEFTTTAAPIDRGNWVEYSVTPKPVQGAEPGAAAAVSVKAYSEVILGTTRMAVVETVAKLLLVPPSRYDFATTQGYYQRGDGGGGTYYSSAFNSSLTNRGNFQSMFDRTTMWSLLQPREGIYLKQYGAKGDGGSDDTLSVNDWFKDIQSRIGIVNVGVFMVQALAPTAGCNLNIRGTALIGNPNGVTPGGGFYYDNCSVFKRLPGVTGSLLTVPATTNSIINLSNLILDGNASADAANAVNYLLFNSGGGACTFRNIIVGNTQGHGVVVNSTANVFDNIRVYNCGGRGMRLSGANACSISDSIIYNCGDNCLTLRAGFRNIVRDTIITDGGVNGIFFESCGDNRLLNLTIEGHKRACIAIDITVGTVQNVFFENCFIADANCATNASTVAGSPAGTWPLVLLEGTNSAVLPQLNSFMNCYMGWHAIGNRYGTNAPRNIFRSTATTLAPYPQWYSWRFINNVYAAPVTTTGVLGNYDPALAYNVSEFGNMYLDSNFYTKFGRSGRINATEGLVLDSVTSATGNDALAVNNTTHLVTKTGTAIVPLGPTLLPAIERRDPPPVDITDP
jgi:hypothetical protein